MAKVSQPISRDDLVASSLSNFFELDAKNQKLYMFYRNEFVRPRILEFWFLRYCNSRNIKVPRSCDGVPTPVTTLYKQRLASFHKHFFSITRIPRRDRNNETFLVLKINNCEYKHTIAEWNVIRFLLEDDAAVFRRFMEDRKDVENACRLHRKLSGVQMSSEFTKSRHTPLGLPDKDKHQLDHAVRQDAALKSA